jgi:hypothetical protein
MDDIQTQIRDLQASVRRQRVAIVTLSCILAGAALYGAASPASDATFDTVTCKAWRVVDKDGKVRIGANVAESGSPVLVLTNTNEVPVVMASVLDGDRGYLGIHDRDGKARLTAAFGEDKAIGLRLFGDNREPRVALHVSANGAAGVRLHDTDGVMRIGADTFSSGNACIMHWDKEGQARMTATTFADSTSLMGWLDKDKRVKFSAGTLPDGTVVYPTQSGK